MSTQPLDSLLQQLCDGDDAAVERVFRTYEPYLRRVVRRQLPTQLRGKFDSVDVVQSVYAHVLQGFREAGWRFAGPGQLRAFLATVTRHRLTDRVRHFHHAIERERPLEEGETDGMVPSADPRPSEMVQADDLWERMLALCPPEHHEVLRLKRQGLLLEEIAERTGLHEGSVRRILRRLARQLAFESPEE
jgi:RNA polymerase sigma-70 factor (ECF subfamily)